jgi:hypothetical protein
VLDLNNLINEFKKESKYNSVDKKENRIKFNIDKEIEELNRLNENYKLNHSLIYNGLAYKIKNIEYNIPTYSDPISWLKIVLIKSPNLS